MFHDTTNASAWHYCYDCSFAGDNLDLAARYWDVSLEEAARQLIDRGLVTSGDGVVSLDASREAVDSFLEFWESRSATDEPLTLEERDLLSALDVEADRCTNDWRRRCGQFVAAATTRDLRYLSTSRATTDRQYAGKRWKEVGISPLYDMPGRIRGFYVIGPGCSGEEGVVHYLPRSSRKVSGLAFLPLALRGPHPEFGNRMFVLNDVLAAVQLHHRSFMLSDTPLPALGCHVDNQASIGDVGQVLSSKEVTLWSRRLWKEIVKQAKTLGAKISTLSDKGKDNRTMRPSVWLEEIYHSARPWYKALEELLFDSPPEDCPHILRYMEMTQEEETEFLSRCDRRVVEIKHRTETTIGRTVTLDDKMVSERRNGWYLLNSAGAVSSTICEAVLRIDEIVQYPSSRNRVYRGRIIYQTHTLEFTEPAEVVERKTFEWIREKVMRANLGVVDFAKQYSERAVVLASKFQSPVFVEGVERYGWDAGQSQFVFANQTINLTGEIVLKSNREVATTTRPSASLTSHEISNLELKSIVLDESEAALGLSLLTHVLANLMAPIYNQRTAGALLVSRRTMLSGLSMAEAIGCDRISPDVRDGAKASDKLFQCEREHGWPVGVDLGQCVPRSWLSDDSPRNVILAVSPYSALTTAMRGGWSRIDDVSCPMPRVQMWSKMVLPFLSWHLSSGRSLPDRDTYPERVLARLLEWMEFRLESTLRDLEESVSASTDFFSYEDDVYSKTTDLFAELLSKLVADGHASLDGSLLSMKNRKRRILRPATAGRVGVVKQALVRTLEDLGALPLDMEYLARALSAKGILDEEVGSSADEFWIDKSWWERKTKKTNKGSKVKRG